MRSNLSIMGLYYDDPTILDPMAPQLPKDDDNAPLLDFNVLRSNILVECAEIEIVYPEPETFKIALEAWSYTREHEWQRMYNALMEEYNPLHNYDRHEEIDRTYTPGAGYTQTSSDPEYTDTITDAESTDTATRENPGFNSGTLVTTEKQTTAHTVDTAGSFSHDVTLEGSLTYTPDGESNIEDIDTHIYGNIGVVSSAQMLSGELSVRKTDMYRIIIDEFRKRFCLLIY